jgi:hypothetical protein
MRWLLAAVLTITVSVGAPAQSARPAPTLGTGKPAGLAEPEISTVLFDLGTDGIDIGGETATTLLTGERQRVRWTKPQTNDAFLVIDATSLRAAGWEVRSPTGATLNGPHLFRTGLRLLSPDGNEIILADAWQLFAMIDRNRDGRVNSEDPEFRYLRLFLDANGNGIMDDGELMYIRDAGVLTIVRTRRPPAHTDVYMNVTLTGSFVGIDGTERVLLNARLADADAAPFSDLFKP